MQPLLLHTENRFTLTCTFSEVAAERRDFLTKDALYNSASSRPQAVSAHSSWQTEVPSWKVPQVASEYIESKVPLTLTFPVWPWPWCSVVPLGLGRVQMAERMWPSCQDSCACRTCSGKKANHPVSWGSRHLPMGDGMSLRNSLVLAPQSQVLKSRY